MKLIGNNILGKFQKRWQVTLLFETVLYAIGPAVLVYFVNGQFWYAFASFLLILMLASLFTKPWRPNMKLASKFIDANIDSAEYSTGLFLTPSDELTGLGKLQQQKIAKRLAPTVKSLKPPSHIKHSFVIAGIFLVMALLANQFNWMDAFKNTSPNIPSQDTVLFQGQDTVSAKTEVPKLIEQQLTIIYPRYTQLGSRSATSMDVKTVKGARLIWKLKFDRAVQNVRMQSMGTEYEMSADNEYYTRSNKVENSGFYNFKFEDLQGNIFSSDLYAIEAVSDTAPEIELKDLDQFTTFNYSEEKDIRFNTVIIDDYGIADSYIIATVSKGSGESVKFREEKITFSNGLNKGAKSLNMSKQLNLDELKLEPGDELYFYVEAMDYKSPLPNVARSETYFAVVKDTASNDFGVEGTLGVDRMPDYFRSQRQLIIDTEKLIKEKPQLSDHDFKFRSNELGFDQKALRLKYGAFMGEENEISTVESEDIGGLDSGDDHDGEHHDEDHDDDEDPLADYTHDHDGDNEHNLVDTSLDENKKSKNPLQEYIHDHGDPEMATLFEESLKSKLLRALGEMWDAELYLRLYKPEESLPYQYEALKLIQEIKNDARIYVHRIGFDPPPIKEDKRLSGKLDEVKSFTKYDSYDHKDDFGYMRIAVKILENIIESESAPTEEERLQFEAAGDELATAAIKTPGLYLQTLQRLNRFINGTDSSRESLLLLRKGLLNAIPKSDPNPTIEDAYLDEIDRLLLKELELND